MHEARHRGVSRGKCVRDQQLQRFLDRQLDRGVVHCGAVFVLCDTVFMRLRARGQ